MSLDRIIRLSSLIPKLDTMEKITSYEGPSSDLGISEKFLLCVSLIPRLSKRLECLAYRHHFYQEYIEIDPDIKTIITASEQVMESSKFSQILRVVLVIGNYLNGTSFRGNARGFKISSLLNLRDTKANSISSIAASGMTLNSDLNIKGNANTLLHYIVRILQKMYPECLDFMESEMFKVGAAGKISINSLIESVTELKAGFTLVGEELKHATPSTNDKFHEVFTRFCENNESKLSSLEANISTLKKNLDTMFAMFAEEGWEKQEEPQLFFDTIAKFGQMIKKARKENESIDVKQKRLNLNTSNSNLTRSMDSSIQDTASLDVSQDSFYIEERLGKDLADEAPRFRFDSDLVRKVQNQESISSSKIEEDDASGMELTTLLMETGLSLQETRKIVQNDEAHLE